jgi:hypothetical protein
MQHLVRQVLAVLAWAFLVGIFVQVALAGIGLFGVSSMDAHMEFGYYLPLVPIAMLIIVWPAHVGRRTSLAVLALTLLTIIQTTLPYFRDSVPVVAALHPPNAMLIFGLTIFVVRWTTEFVRRPSEASQAS